MENLVPMSAPSLLWFGVCSLQVPGRQLGLRPKPISRKLVFSSMFKNEYINSLQKQDNNYKLYNQYTHQQKKNSIGSVHVYFFSIFRRPDQEAFKYWWDCPPFSRVPPESEEQRPDMPRPAAPPAASLNRQLALWDFALAGQGQAGVPGAVRIELGQSQNVLLLTSFINILWWSGFSIFSYSSARIGGYWRLANHNISQQIKQEKLELSIEAAWNNGLKTAAWGPPHLLSHGTHTQHSLWQLEPILKYLRPHAWKPQNESEPNRLSNPEKPPLCWNRRLMGEKK